MYELIAAIIGIFFVWFALGASWFMTCGIIKLITLCFGWTFSWRIATGIWLLIALARSVFNVILKK